MQAITNNEALVPLWLQAVSGAEFMVDAATGYITPTTPIPAMNMGGRNNRSVEDDIVTTDVSAAKSHLPSASYWLIQGCLLAWTGHGLQLARLGGTIDESARL